MCLILYSINSLGDGSRNLYPSGSKGRRAYLNSVPPGVSSAVYNAFSTSGTMKVYAKAGEIIYAGSSAQGRYVGTYSSYYGHIVMRSPNGNTYDSGNSATVGYIATRNQELAGPNLSGMTSGYTPFTHTVVAAEEGIWEVDFVSPKYSTDEGASHTSAYPDYADGQWTEPLNTGTQDIIAAFDLSVGSTTALIPGRVYCNVFNGTLNGVFTDHEGGFYGVFYVLTSNGHVYKVDNNGQNGYSFEFFVNNKGVQSGGLPTYQSFNGTGISGNIYDPRQPDNGSNDITHKLFFEYPAADMPTSAPISYNGGSTTTTWLKNIPPDIPSMTNISLVGIEGVPGQVGPKGANITFTANVDASYTLTIHSTSGSYIDRKISGIASVGANTVYWDGKDGAGAQVAGGTSLEITGLLFASEVHFPLVDVEINPTGIIIELLDNSKSAVSDVIFWDDSNITTQSGQSASNPKNGNTVSGQHSVSNGHKWGSYVSTANGSPGEFGNNRTLDTWGYVGIPPTSPLTLNLVSKVLDLEVTSITPSSTMGCKGSPLTYTVVVKNLNSNSSYVDAVGAQFGFVAPEGYTVTGHTFSTTTGTATEYNTVTSNNTYTANIDLTIGGEIIYTITCSVGYGTEAATAYVIRPPDVTDVDATSTSGTGVPTDPQVECDGAPTGIGCNNIKTALVTVTSISSSGVITPVCTSATQQTTSLSYTAATNTPTSYSIDWNGAANTAGLSDQGSTSFTSSASGGTIPGIIIPSNVTSGSYDGIINISNSSGCTNSLPVSIIIGAAITTQPVAPAAVCSGNGSVSLSVTAVNITNYQWYKDGNVVTNGTSGSTTISGATTALLTVANPTTSNAGNYIMVVTSSSCGTATSTTVPVVVNSLPTASISTSAQTLCQYGGAVPLSVTATAGSGTISSYQWYKNSSASNSGGTLISGAIGGTYTPSTTATGTLYYYVIVSNSNGCSSTSNVSGGITVYAVPTISTQPSTTAQNLCNGDTSTALSVSASAGSGSIIGYQWYSNTFNSNNGGTLISGGTNNSYTPPTSVNGALYYYVVVRNSNGCTTASNVSGLVTVSAVVTAGTVSPASQSICSGNTPTTLSLSGQNGTILNWQKSTSASFSSSTTLSVTSSTLTSSQMGTLTANTTYYFRAVVDGCSGNIYSTSSTVVVGNAAPTISSQPSTTAQTVCQNGTATAFSVTAAAGSGSISTYQWYSNIANVNYGGNLVKTTTSTSTSNTYTPLTTELDGLYYYVVVTNSNGCSVTSNVSGLVTVVAPSVGGIVSSNQTICSGSTPANLVLSGYTGSITKWQKSTNNFSTSTDISSTSAILTGTTIGTLVTTTSFRAVVTNSVCSSANSTSATITISIPAIVTQPSASSQTVCANSTTSPLSVVASAGSGASIASYSWYRNSSASTSGGTLVETHYTSATTDTYTPSVSGYYYYVVVSNSLDCSVTSSVSGKISVNASPAINSQPLLTPQNLCHGSLATALSVTATAGSGTISTYQWYSNTLSSNISGGVWVATHTSTATTDTYTPLTSSDGTLYYYVVVTNSNGCSVTSNVSGGITVNGLPTITGTTTVCSGNTTQLAGSSTAASSNPWTSSVTSIATVTTSGLVTGVAAGSSTITYTNSVGCSNSILVTVNALPTIALSGSAASVCYSTSSQTTTLPYSGTTNIPTTYSINWDSSPSNSFATVSNAALSSSPIAITVPAATSAGIYTGYLTVRNGNGCTSGSTNTFTVTVNAIPTTTYELTHVSCFGGNDGKIKITVAGGTGSYYFSINNGTSYTITPETTHTFTGLSANTFTIRVKDMNGCVSVP